MCAGAEPRQARFLRRQALVLSEAFLATLDAGLSAVELAAELEAAPGAAPPPSQQRQQQQQHAAAEGAAAMEVDGVPAAATQEQQGEEPAAPQASPAPAGTQPSGPAAATPAEATRGGPRRAATPGTDLRAALGTPGALPSAEVQQLQERGMALLAAAHGFHKDVTRWLQVRCAR